VSDPRVVLIQTRYQLASVARNRRAVVFSLVFPVVLLVMFNSVFVKHADTVKLDGVTLNAHAYFTGAMLAYAIMLSGFNQLAISLIMQRETGQLKRLRGTPLPAWTFIVATVLRAIVTVGVLAIVLLAIGHFSYDVPLPGRAVGGVALYVVLGTAAMCSVGIAVTSLVSDVDSASGVLPLAAVVLALISGIFVPIDQLPTWLADVARVFPVYHLAAGLQLSLGSGGTTLGASNFAALAAWGLGGILVATRRFRWEPQAVPA
jgi:ABC-2 type transport system permease protein